MPRARAPQLELTDSLVAAAEAAVHAARFVPTKKLVTGKLSRHDEVLLIEKLVARGLERTPRGVRVALADQVLSVMPAAGRSSFASLASQVAGATRTEVKREAIRQVEAGRLALVPAIRGEELVRAGAHLLAPDDLDALRDTSKALAKLVTKLRPRKGAPPKTLERAELRALLAPLIAAATSVSDGPSLSRERVLSALSNLARERGRSVFIPDVLRELGADRQQLWRQAHEVLFELARSGRIELRPESGVGNLSATDRALCPSGADGLVISYARVVQR